MTETFEEYEHRQLEKAIKLLKDWRYSYESNFEDSNNSTDEIPLQRKYTWKQSCITPITIPSINPTKKGQAVIKGQYKNRDKLFVAYFLKKLPAGQLYPFNP